MVEKILEFLLTLLARFAAIRNFIWHSHISSAQRRVIYENIWSKDRHAVAAEESTLFLKSWLIGCQQAALSQRAKVRSIVDHY